MDAQKLRALMEQAVDDADLVSAEIPSIDLYLEQILQLVAEKGNQGSSTVDRTLTKNMINNYSKDGLITPVKGKKYTKEQIIQILLIYTLKGTLSIGEIKRMLEGAYSVEGFGCAEITELYDKYYKTKENIREYSSLVSEKMLDSIKLGESITAYINTKNRFVIIIEYSKLIKRFFILKIRNFCICYMGICC